MGVADQLREDGPHAGAVSESDQLGRVRSLLMGSECELGHGGIGVVGGNGAESDRDHDVGAGHVGTGARSLP